MALLQRLHRWLQERQSSRVVRLWASVVVVLAIGATAFPMLNTALSLRAQQQEILLALKDSSAKKEDPAALQLFTRNTVTANGRDYGGPRTIPKPADLFNDDGVIEEGTKRDLAWRLVADQVPAWMPYFLVRTPEFVIGSAVAAMAALLAVVWFGLLVPVLEWGAVFAAIAALFWLLGWTAALQGLVAMALALLMFAMLWRLVSGALSSRRGPIAVARTTVIEGVRTFAAPSFVLPVALLLPVLALSRDPNQALYLAVPGFLDWGHTVVYTAAALLVIFFGCATTAFEIRDRQVWTVLTKPLSRIGWLAGKWIGTMALATVVLVGGGIMLGTGTGYLASQRPVDERDARDLRDTVLVGRVGTPPIYELLAPDRLREIVEQTISADPVLKSELDNGKQDRNAVARSIGQLKQKEFLEAQRRIPIGDGKSFSFAGLREPAALGRPMALRYKLHGGADDTHQKFPVVFECQSGKKSGQWEQREWVPTETYSFRIEPDMVDAEGNFKVRILNVGFDENEKKFIPGALPIYIDTDGLEVMATHASFELNLAQALMIDFIKVAFLASMAVVAGAVLSFPIAVLLAFGVYAMATLTPFLNVALSEYRPDERNGIVILVFQWAIRLIAMVVEFALHGFAERSPSDSLAQGRAVTGFAVFQAFLSIGLAWSCGVMAVGWAWIRRKEIAVYSGQG